MKKGLSVLLVLIFAVGFAGWAEAGMAGIISGEVKDAYTGLPVAAATINTNSGSVRTVDNGFYFTMVPSGSTQVTASAYGYVASYPRALYVSPGESEILNISLVPSNSCAATLTPDVEIFIPIMSYSGGQYYTVDMRFQQSANGALLFKINSLTAQSYNPRYYGCASSISTLSPALKVHIPVMIYQTYSMWADFEYYPTTDGATWLKLTNFGYN